MAKSGPSRPRPLTLRSLTCLLYTSDAADEGLGVDLGGRRIIKKKTTASEQTHVSVMSVHTISTTILCLSSPSY
ncbi:hypothetical protein AMBR_CKHPCMOK_02848 [Lacticaseibacillus rhamnosus]|nr:hypothetical protein AMBR_CKHPCMOK_02848 [Lacticaseibacillus rhamnosus]